MTTRSDFEDGRMQGLADWVWENKFLIERYHNKPDDWYKGYQEGYHQCDES